MNQIWADSTIGVTAYNAIAMGQRGGLTVEQILTIARRQHPCLEQSQLERALEKLVRLQRVKNMVGGGYDLVAPRRLFVVKRDLTDYNVSTMDGGWGGWTVKTPERGYAPLEQIMRGEK